MTAQPAKCRECRTIVIPPCCLEQPVERNYPRLTQEVLHWLTMQGITEWYLFTAPQGQDVWLHGRCEEVTAFQMRWC